MAPEMWKIRQVVVRLARPAQPSAWNRAWCLPRRTVQCTPPRSEDPWDVPFAAKAYPSLPKASWAKCASITLVSHARLDRVIAGRGYRGDFVSEADMARVEAGLRAAFGL